MNLYLGYVGCIQETLFSFCEVSHTLVTGIQSMKYCFSILESFFFV